MNQFQPVVGQRTDRGRARPRNEDAVGEPPPGLEPSLAEQKGYLYAVADGMGGEAGGQQASTLAIRTLIAEYYRDPEPDVGRSLWRAVQASNRSVYLEALRNPSLARMGTTLTAAVIRGEDLVVAHVGDSRAYLIRNDQIRQLTRDHTWVGDAIRAGIINTEQARNHPDRHILTRALGSEPEVQVDVVSEKLRPGDRVLLSTDGLTNLVGDGEILQRVQKLGPQKAPDALVDLANERGGQDNVTAMVISVPGGPARRVPPRAAAPRPSGVPWPVFGGLVAVMVVMVMVFRIRELISKPDQAAATQTAVAQTTTAQVVAVEATQTAIAATQMALAQPTATQPATPTATHTTIPTPTTSPTTAPRPGIVVGGYVQVAGVGELMLNLRDGPGINYAQVELLPDGIVLKVIDGPQEADGLWWWRLEDLTDGTLGWAADKWLVATVAPTGTPTPTPTTTPTSTPTSTPIPTPTLTATPTRTAVPTSTVTPTPVSPTPTPIPPTPTPIPPTPTPVPPTPTPSPPPTDTPTPTKPPPTLPITPTPTPTDTPTLPPTATPTPELSPTPTETRSSQPP